MLARLTKGLSPPFTLCQGHTQQTISASRTDIRTNGEGKNERTSRRTNHEIKYTDAQIHTSASSRTPGKQPDGEGSIARDRANSQREGRQAAQGAGKQPEVGRQAAGATAGRGESLSGGWAGNPVHSVRSNMQVSTAREHSKWQTPAR